MARARFRFRPRPISIRDRAPVVGLPRAPDRDAIVRCHALTCRRLRRPHEAADHRAAAGHHRAHAGRGGRQGLPPLRLVIWTVLGGTLAAGGANAINMVVDRDIDRLMDRTKNRPLVTGEVTPREALVFAIALEVLAFVAALDGRSTC